MSADEVVVDASLALKWAVDEPYSSTARDLLERWHIEGRRILAPSLFSFEVTNVLSQRMRRAQLPLTEASERLNYLLVEVAPILLQSGDIHHRALELTAHFGLRAAYDAHYLALAESHDCEFWTADERLWNSVRHELTWVRWIGES